MTQRDARSDWQAFAADAIPTKANVRPLETVLADIMATFGEAGPPSILDAGCGVGVVSGFIYSKGFSVVGVDINQSAVVQALRSTAALSQAQTLLPADPSISSAKIFLTRIALPYKLARSTEWSVSLLSRSLYRAMTERPCWRIYIKHFAPEATSIFQHQVSPMPLTPCMQSSTDQT